MHHALLIALGAAVSTSAIAGGTLPPIGSDLDGNGTIETEGSWITRSLGFLSAGSTVTFSYAFMTDEDPDPDDYNDVFRVRLFDADSGETLAMFGGAVDDPSYNGDVEFEAFDFENPDVDGSVRTPQGLGGSLVFDSGIIGWNEMTLTVPAAIGAGEPSGGEVMIEFLVADSDDTAAESALAIDGLIVNSPTGAPIGLSNAGFESGLAGWAIAGEAMTLANLLDDDSLAEVFFADEGSLFALIATNRIPAPGGAALLALAALAGLRRRR